MKKLLTFLSIIVTITIKAQTVSFLGLKPFVDGNNCLHVSGSFRISYAAFHKIRSYLYLEYPQGTVLNKDLNGNDFYGSGPGCSVPIGFGQNTPIINFDNVIDGKRGGRDFYYARIWIHDETNNRWYSSPYVEYRLRNNQNNYTPPSQSYPPSYTPPSSGHYETVRTKCTSCNGTGLQSGNTWHRCSTVVYEYGCEYYTCPQCSQRHCIRNTIHEKCISCHGTGYRESQEYKYY